MLQVTKELLKEMTDIIVREVNPRKIILFGSHARGTARRDSDLDFLVVEDGPFSKERSRESEMTRLWDILFEYNIPIDFLVFTPEEVVNSFATGRGEIGAFFYHRAAIIALTGFPDTPPPY